MTTSNTEQLTEKEASTIGRYASINGLEMYYEVHGTHSAGNPLMLLHGGLGEISMFAQVLPSLAENRHVIAVEVQGHGHTADIDRPLSYEQVADDVAALIKHLSLEDTDILGYSLGGGFALQTAIRHPELVRKLVIVSATCKRDGWYAQVLDGMASVTAEVAKGWVGSPMHAAYASIAPKPEDWPMLAGKLGDLLRQDYDWSSAVAAIKSPALIIIGDADGVRPAHAAEMFAFFGGKTAGIMERLPDSQLAVLPGTTHFSILSRTDLLLPIIVPFLDAPGPSA